MKIDNIKVYGLAESIVASGFPMLENYDEHNFSLDSSFVFKDLEKKELDDNFKKHLERAKKLASCKGGESHDCALCGIIVQMNITAPRYWWQEMSRYHFFDIVSSTSTMHRLKSFLKKAIELKRETLAPKYQGENDAIDYEKNYDYFDLYCTHFSPATSTAVFRAFVDFAEMFLDNDNIELLKANLPEGWLQTARVTTNYRQLRTIKRQRKNHRLNEWREFCKWIDSLPMAKELIQ